MSHPILLQNIFTEDDAIESPTEVNFGQWLNLDDLPSIGLDAGHTYDQPFLDSSANDLIDIEVSGILRLQTNADIFQPPSTDDGEGATNSWSADLRSDLLWNQLFCNFPLRANVVLGKEGDLNSPRS
jgi:hypothetical protein